MLTNLYFVRHAHSTYTPDEIGRPLSFKGYADAEKITKTLEIEHIDFVISSPYKRAIQTVNGIAKLIDREVILMDGFKERVLSEKPVTDFSMAITKVWEDYTYALEGGESNITAQQRGVNATIQVLKRYPGKNIVVGTHGNIMVLIMNYFDKNYDFSFWNELEMPDIYKLTFDKATFKQANRIWNKL